MEGKLRCGHHHELSNAVARCDDVILIGIVINQNDLDFSAITRVDKTGSVETRDARTGRETRPRQNKAAVPFGNGESKTRGHHGAAPASLQYHFFDGDEVTAGVTRVGNAREDRIGVESLNRNPHGARLPLARPRRRLRECLLGWTSK